MKTLLSFAILLSSLFASFGSSAEISKSFGDIEIHYNAISTTELLPEIARSYGIERSPTRGLVTMSVLRKDPAGLGEPTPAKISLYFTTLSQQLSRIDMREIREGPAIYYLGEFRISAPDTLKFTATIDLPGEPKREMDFTQSFFR